MSAATPRRYTRVQRLGVGDLVCSDCGSVVVSREAHDAFHRRVEPFAIHVADAAPRRGGGAWVRSGSVPPPTPTAPITVRRTGWATWTAVCDCGFPSAPKGRISLAVADLEAHQQMHSKRDRLARRSKRAAA